MTKRQLLRDNVEFLAEKYRADCPFAAAVLRSLAGAIDLDIDRELSEATLSWMVRKCQRMQAEVRASFMQIVEANADAPRIKPSDN